MAWQQNWSQPLSNFTMPGIPAQNPMGPYNPMQFNPAMTPDHYAMQQNWQQWQTYQQQYAQWQAQYGEKYQQEMQQKFNPNTSIMPPILPQVASMPPNLPPPPPGPAPLPPPPPDSAIESLPTSNLIDPLNQRSFQAAVTSGTINRNSNFLNQPVNNQQFNRGIGGGINQNQNQYSGLIGRNQFESVANNVPKVNEPVAKPVVNQMAEDVSDKTPEEKAFDEQFKKWEEEFANWKLQNANHPDTRAYMEYEQKMEECRTKLLERREQMKRRKLELLQQQKQQQQQQSQQHIPAIPQESLRIPNEQKTSGYNQTTGAFENNKLKDPIGGRDSLPLLENSAIDKGELFMRSTLSSSGIPGLDLVMDKPNDKDNDDNDVDETIIINDTSPQRQEKIPHQISNIQQRPDLEAISRGLTSILGDPNLASLLSNFQAPKSISNSLAKPAIPSLLDMKMPDIDMDKVPRFNWKDDDDDGDDSIPSNSQQTNDLSNNAQNTPQSTPQNTPQNSNQLMNNCEDEQYDDDYEENMEQHERFNERNYDDSNNSFPMNRGDANNFSNPNLNARDNFNRNMNMTQNRGNNFGSLNQNFMNDNEPNDNFQQNRSNFMNDNGPKDNFNRMNFMNDRPNENFNRPNFNENLRGNNTFVGGGNAGNFNQQNAFNFQGNRMNPFDKPVFGNNSNFNNDRNPSNNNFQQNANFSGNNNFGNNFNRPMMNDQFNNDNNEFINGMRNDDRSNNDFSRRRNFDNNERNFNDFDGSNSQFPLSFRNNNRSDDNSHSQNTQQMNSTQNRGLPTDSFISDNAKDEDFFRPTKIIDYSANNTKPTQITPKDEGLVPMKVIDYGHQTGIVSRPQNARPRPANKCTGNEFFPVKTIDYNHSSNKHMIKEYYYSIVSKWDPSSSKSIQSQGPNRSNTEGHSNIQPTNKRAQPPPQIHKTKELKEITYEQLSGIDTSTRHGKKMKRTLIMKRSTVNDYPIGHKFFPSVKWHLLNEESRKRPSLPTKRGVRKRKNGTVIPLNKTLQPSNEVNDEYEEILSNDDDDSLEDYEMIPDDFQTDKVEDEKGKTVTKIPSPIRPVIHRPLRQNVVLIEDLIYNPGRQRRPHKIVIIMRGPPGSGKTFLAKLIKDKETENGGVGVRILSIDDYFKTEVDEIRKCPETGKNLNLKKMIYEYEQEMEDTYMQYLMKSYKKTVVDGLFDFIIVDSINSTLRHYTEFYNFAKVYAFTPYTCELETNPDICFKRNIHQRTFDEIKNYCANWSKTPEQYLKLDFDSFVQDAKTFEVDDN